MISLLYTRLFLLLFSFRPFLFLLFFLMTPSHFTLASESYWETQRRGFNLFNETETLERLKAAHEMGAQFVRLTPSKWIQNRPHHDFLTGDPTQPFEKLDSSDLITLKKTLDLAHLAGLKVVLVPLSLPGARWKQHNDGIAERKLWQDFAFHKKSALFWKLLATELRSHPAIAAYNILNEPSPEFVPPQLKDWVTGDYPKWYRKIKNTPADINLYYRNVIKEIRKVDPLTPIAIESGFFAHPYALQILEPLGENILYSFHMYEPSVYNSRENLGKYAYPGEVPLEGANQTRKWNLKELSRFLDVVSTWQKKNQIRDSQILVGEVGVFRKNAGSMQYLKDLTQIFNRNNWHWAFYSFREDSWDGMNYELGDGKNPPEEFSKMLQSALQTNRSTLEAGD